VRGIPCVLIWPLPNWRLSRVGANGICPLTIPARDKSPAEARTKLLPRTAVRPKSPARTLVTALVNRAFW
jgi:hypothetical protein